METVKLLSSFMVLSVNSTDRISFTYDQVDPDTGTPVSQNNKESFYVVDNDLKAHIEAIREYIRTSKLAE